MRTTTRTTFLLIATGSRTGTLAELTLQIREKEMEFPSRGSVYSILALMFVELDQFFKEAANKAYECACDLVGIKKTDWDIRWRMERCDREQLGSKLIGPSAGAAFALGLAKLLADRMPTTGISDSTMLCLLKDLDLNGTSATAEILLKNELRQVGKVNEKLITAALHESFPRIHTVIVAEEQELGIRGLVTDKRNLRILRDPDGKFHILKAASLRDAIRLLTVHLTTQWETRYPTLSPPNRDFVGRYNLLSEVS